MRTACSLALLALVVSSAVVASPAPRSGAEPRVIQIEVGDNMKFVPAAITAAPGESIRVVIKHVGQMPKVAMGHNFVLLKKGVDARKLADKCSSARDTEFIIPAVKGDLLASTRLVGPGETADTTFVAPAVRGEYQFICTFPGHFAVGMKGTLTVK
jgi:azurin